MSKEVVSAFAVECLGPNPFDTKKKVQVSVTVCRDDSREVGCGFINANGTCGNSKLGGQHSCIHLRPTVR